jgi:hypothetical protein
VDGKAYGSPVNFEASPWSGLFRPAADQTQAFRWSDAGLIVPDRSMAAARLGAVPTEAASAWFQQYVKAYVTAGDYLTGALAARGLPFDPVPLINSLLRLHPREVYLPVLVALNHAAHYPELAEAWRDRYLARLNPAMAENVRRALDGTADGVTRALLARQPVLRAMRTVLTHRPPAGSPAAGALAAAVPGLDPELAAILLVHLVAAQLRAPYTAGDRMLGDLPEGLAMEMVANGLFHGHDRPDVLLARTRMLWNTYGTQIDLGRLKLRARPLDLLREATGLDFEDIAALTVAYYGYTSALQPGGLPGVNAFAGIKVGRGTVETYLASFASTPDELADRLDACPGSWQMLPIQERPLLRIGEVILVLDEQYLIERATQGLYWFVHEHERSLDGERGWKRWNGAYANMVERRAEDQLRRLAPPLLGGGSALFTEEDLQAAFPRSKNSDAGIDFGELTLLAEVVTGQASLATRENASVTAYAADIEKLFVKKARQLDEAAASLLRDPQPDASPLGKPARRILPVTVRGWQFPLNRLTRKHIEDALRGEGLLNYRRPAVPVAAIAPVDLEELEMCETLHETRGLSLHDLITRWQESADFSESSFRSFLTQAYGGPPARPADLQAELARTLTLIAERLGTRWSPGLPEPGQPAGTE